MCFNQEISFILGALGLAFGAWIHFSKNRRDTGLGVAYFALMEMIQFIQYFWIDDCDRLVNKAWTYVAYVHVCFQPYFFNKWLNGMFIEETDKVHWNKVIFRLCIMCALLMLTAVIPNNPVYQSWHCSPSEHLCGHGKNPPTCTYSGNLHLAWRLDLYASYFQPTMTLHCFMWFIPMVIFGYWKVFCFTVPVLWLSVLLTENVDEQPAIWCLMFIPGCILTMFVLGGPSMQPSGPIEKKSD